MDPRQLQDDLGRWLAEDIGWSDITTAAIFADGSPPARARFIAKGALVACGMGRVAARVFRLRNPAVTVERAATDGTRAAPGDVLLEVCGPAADLLTAERLALNLAMRLSGIATLTARFVDAVAPYGTVIADTRKTTPGLRTLEKYAVRVGGGRNHRFGLADGVLIKDNHIAACNGSIGTAVARVRARAPHTLRIEVEAATLDDVRACLEAGVEVIMLDNMGEEEMRRAVDLVAGRALTEASGNVTLDNVARVAATGVDIISIGALTHSAPAADISMRLELL